MINNHPTFEKDKQSCLQLGIDICKQGLSSVKYFNGYRTVKRGDNYVTKEVYETLYSPYSNEQKSFLEKFKNDFNDLPTTRKALAGYNEEIEKLQKDIDVFIDKLNIYFKENPKIEKEYKKTASFCFVLSVILLFMSGLTPLVLGTLVTQQVCLLILTSLLLASIGFVVLAVIRKKQLAKNREKILNQLPPELIGLKEIHHQSQIKLQSVKKDKKAFEKKNVKK
jgi:hypothetical protein